jgi:hypothetical protein
MAQRSITHIPCSLGLVTQTTCVPGQNCSCRDTETLLDSD